MSPIFLITKYDMDVSTGYLSVPDVLNLTAERSNTGSGADHADITLKGYQAGRNALMARERNFHSGFPSLNR